MIQFFASAVLGGFRKYAELFVCVAWLLVLLSIVSWLVIGLSSAIPLTYFPLHPDAPIDRARSDLVGNAVIVAVVTAAISLAALLIRFRFASALIVVMIWSVFLVGATIKLSSVLPGPQTFQLSVGAYQYAIPWQFGPTAQPGGFYVRICPDDLQGAYGVSCLGKIPSIQLFVNSGKDVATSFEMQAFEKAQPRMASADGLHDHQKGYIYTVPSLKEGQPPLISRYYLRSDANGRPMRIVNCSRYGFCKHVAAVGQYVLGYSAKESDFANWSATDRRFINLIESWRTN